MIEHKGVNCGIKYLLKYNMMWYYDKVKGDYYNYVLHLYLSEYENKKAL